MGRMLMVTWDGAGNLVATLGVARALAASGHDVRVLGHESIARRCGSAGWRFRPLTRTPDFDSTAPADPELEMKQLPEDVWFNDGVGHDLLDELAREPADAVIVDCMLFAGLAAARSSGVPTAALFHTCFSNFRGGPMVEMLSAALPGLNAYRASLGLASVERLGDAHDECDLALVATPREFELDLPFPANVRFLGPISDGGALLTPTPDEMTVDDRAPELPLVLLSMSTSHQGQALVLQRLVDALADAPARVVVTTGFAVDPATVATPANTTMVRFVPHDRVLRDATAVVTHAGLGTVMAALAHGVPMVCVPLGRDQFFNAARVEALGAGRSVRADANPAEVRAALYAILAPDAPERTGATAAAGVLASYGGARTAVAELEQLLARG